jgi:hypothetical protein
LARGGIVFGAAYFAAAWLGLALRAYTGTSVFWPAAGVAVGALIVCGPGAWFPVASGLLLATTAANLMNGRSGWLSVAFGLVEVAPALAATTLIERWFGRSFKLGDVPQILGFLGAATIGSAVGAMGGTIAIDLTQSIASHLGVCRFWFTSSLLGMVTVAPLVVGIAEALRRTSPRRELIEGAVGVLMLAVSTAFIISLPLGAWSTALPVVIVFPILPWIVARCPPVFAAAAAFVVALAVIWSITFSVGYFGEAGIPPADRILAAQTLVLAGALLTLVLAALFAERRYSEVVLKQSRQRLQLALDGAKLGTFSADLATGRFECDARTALIMDTMCRLGRLENRGVLLIGKTEFASTRPWCRKSTTAAFGMPNTGCSTPQATYMLARHAGWRSKVQLCAIPVALRWDCSVSPATSLSASRRSKLWPSATCSWP